jgi:hypothetical protein
VAGKEQKMIEPFDEVINLRHVEAMQKRSATMIAVRFSSGINRIYDFKNEEDADCLMEVYFKEYTIVPIRKIELKDGAK